MYFKATKYLCKLIGFILDRHFFLYQGKIKKIENSEIGWDNG